MARTQVINEDPFCAVDTEVLQMGGKESNKCVIRLQNTETKQMEAIDCLGAIHNADTYALITNQRLHQAANDIMTRSGMQFDPLPEVNGSASAGTLWDGKRFTARYYSQDVVEDIDDEKGSRLMLGMQVTNSYDGSLSCAMEFFIMNQLCSNQFYSNHLISGFNLKHYKSANADIEFNIDDAVRALEGQASQFANVVPKFKALTNTTLGRTVKVAGKEKSEANVDNLGAFLMIRQKLAKIWKPTYDGPLLDELCNRGISKNLAIGNASGSTNLWELLNAYTAVATHKIGGFNGMSINRMVTDTILNMLPNAA